IGAGAAVIPGVTIPTVDQRGTARPTSKFDIGAYQSTLPATAPAISNNSTTTGSTSHSVTTTTTSNVVQSAPIGTVAVATSHVKATKTAKHAAKLKVVSKKNHPSGGAAARFHKTGAAAKVHKTAAPKARQHLAIAKAHPAAHAKKK